MCCADFSIGDSFIGAAGGGSDFDDHHPVQDIDRVCCDENSGFNLRVEGRCSVVRAAEVGSDENYAGVSRCFAGTNSRALHFWWSEP
jgi:hypothetical protein